MGPGKCFKLQGVSTPQTEAILTGSMKRCNTRLKINDIGASVVLDVGGLCHLQALRELTQKDLNSATDRSETEPLQQYQCTEISASQTLCANVIFPKDRPFFSFHTQRSATWQAYTLSNVFNLISLASNGSSSASPALLLFFRHFSSPSRTWTPVLSSTSLARSAAGRPPCGAAAAKLHGIAQQSTSKA